MSRGLVSLESMANHWAFYCTFDFSIGKARAFRKAINSRVSSFTARASQLFLLAIITRSKCHNRFLCRSLRASFVTASFARTKSASIGIRSNNGSVFERECRTQWQKRTNRWKRVSFGCKYLRRGGLHRYIIPCSRDRVIGGENIKTHVRSLMSQKRSYDPRIVIITRYSRVGVLCVFFYYLNYLGNRGINGTEVIVPRIQSTTI